MRLMVYSHDAFGLGNIRRMLAICKYLLDSLPGLSILVVSGSPVLHSFRIPKGLDYIKLPCLGRDETGELSAKYLGTPTEEVLKLRSDLILAAAINYKPDLLLVDKKPYALRGELKDTLDYLKTFHPKTKAVLLLRDILDNPEVTIKEWQENGYYEGVDLYYDQALVVGTPEVFDFTKEYQLPASISQKVQFCGYIRREHGLKSREVLRQELQLNPKEQLVLVTPGGGADGYRLVDTYFSGLMHLPTGHNIRSLIVSGPEMPLVHKQEFYQLSEQYPHVQISEFTDDLMSYIEAADTVVSMAGYNTICEILSLGKRAVIVPRTQPVKEQWIRAERMANLGLFKAIHPDVLTPKILMDAVLEQLNSGCDRIPSVSRLDFNALPRIASYFRTLLYGETQPRENSSIYPNSVFYLGRTNRKILIH